MKKRILSMMLTLCIVLMLVPTTVFAETTTDGDFTYSVSDDKVTITRYNNNNATEVIIPDTIDGRPVTSIGAQAFMGCTGLTGITIQSGVTSIGSAAFMGCTSLASITIPNSVTSIDESSFRGCTSLTNITIPSGVTSIGNWAFGECTSLTSITIPSSVTSIDKSSFRGCASLTSITVDENNTAYSSVNGVLFNKDKTELVRYPEGNTNTLYHVPSGVTQIVNGAFYGCTSLASIMIPSGVTRINHLTFCGCTSLANITIPSSVELIGNDVFRDCTSLTSITIPSGVTSITDRAFYGCTSLTSIFLPDGVRLINAEIRYEATKVGYSLDETAGEVTITKIELGTDNTSVDIPDKIYDYPVVAVTPSEQLKIGTHTCRGGTATCTAKAICSLCGKEHGDFTHSFTAKTIKPEVLKTVGTCQSEAVYYYSCAVCSKVEFDDNHTFMGGVDSSNHNLDKIPAKAATVTETGNKEHWQCKDCGKYFSDKDGKNSIEQKVTVTPKLPPEMIEGTGQSLTAGEKKELTFRSNAAFSDFIRVELDGKTLDEKNYTVTEGSTVVILKADYVAILSAGKHTIGIVSTNGTAAATFTVNAKAAVDNDTKAPQTEGNNTKAPQTEGNDIKFPQTEGNDIKFPQIGGNDIKAPQTEGDDIKFLQIGDNDTKALQTGGDDIKAPQIGDNDTKAPQTGGNDIKFPQIGDNNTTSPQTEGYDTKAPQPEGNDTKAPQTEGDDTKAPQIEGNDTKAPQTEDNSMMWLGFVLLLVSGIGIAGVTVYRKRKKAE